MLDQALFHKHLEDDEIVATIVHKHWLFGVRALILPSVSLFLSLLFFLAQPTQAGLLVVTGWAGLSIIWWIHSFLDYYLDAWMITNHGIIDLEWHGWFHRQSSRILYSDVQGVSYEIHGVLGTLLRYGTIAVEKISTGAAVSLTHVSHPRRIESAILTNMETYLHSKNLKDAKHVQDLLSQFVAHHVNEQSISPGKKAATDDKPSPSRPTKKAFTSSRI